MRFQFEIEHGTEEGGEEMVTLGKTGAGVYRRLRVRALATDVRELLLITRPEGLVKLQGLLRRVITRDTALAFRHPLHAGFGLSHLRREVRSTARSLYVFGLSHPDNLHGTLTRLLPTVMMLQFLPLRRVFLEVAGAADSV